MERPRILRQGLFPEGRGLFGSYDALQAFSKGVWLPLPKRKMNFVPLIVCLGWLFKGRNRC